MRPADTLDKTLRTRGCWLSRTIFRSVQNNMFLHLSELFSLLKVNCALLEAYCWLCSMGIVPSHWPLGGEKREETVIVF